MRIDHPSIGEYLQPPRRKADAGGLHRAAAAAVTQPVLSLPSISPKVPRQIARHTGNRALGLIGGWLVESNRMPLALWNPDKPIESIQAALAAALTAAGTKRDMLHVEFGQDIEKFYLPECTSGGDYTGDASTVYFGIHNLFQEVFYAPRLMQLAVDAPKVAEAVNGLLQIALDETVGGFGPARAWNTASYHYWCGEVTGTVQSLSEDDAAVQQMIDEEMTGEDCPLPSQLAEDIPFCLHWCRSPRRLDAACTDPAIVSAYFRLVTAYRRMHRKPRDAKSLPANAKPFSAWGFHGETNYDGEQYVIWTPSSQDADTDYTVAMFDNYMNDLMNTGTGSSLMGLAQVQDAKQFGKWLESVERGCNVVDAALDLLETLA